MNTVAELIPAHRFGSLLAETRTKNGLDLADVASQTDGRFSVEHLADLERGNDLLSESDVALLASFYGLRTDHVLPQRAKLCLDLDARIMRVGTEIVQLGETAEHDILQRYLSIVYMLRGIQAGAEVPLRNDDLAILSASLHERIELIEEQLLAMMVGGDPALVGLVERLGAKLWVPGAGILVGAVGLGALVFATGAEAKVADNTSIDAGVTAPATVVVEMPGPIRLADPVSERLSGEVASPTLFEVPPAEGAPSRTTVAPTPTGDSSTPPVATPSTDNPMSSETVTEPPSPIGAEPAPQTPEPAAADVVSLHDALREPTMAALGLDVEKVLPGWTVEFLPERPGFRGVTFRKELRIEMYVQAGDSPERLAGILAHEVGHAIDLTYLTEQDRHAWLAARGITNPWWPGDAAPDFATGAGDFAEAFAELTTGDPSESVAAGALTESQIELLNRLVGPIIG